MRLLKRLPNGDIHLVSIDDDHPPPYAILSHTWEHGQEVTYNDLVTGTGKDKSGYAKIRFCVDRAAQDGIEHSWVDTCCIDKSVQQELQTAINSMFRWYKSAERCYVYLSDLQTPKQVADDESVRVSCVQGFGESRWFTRAWTLQELLAPAIVEFFSREGKLLGSRISLEEEIHKITKIPTEAMRGQALSDFGVDVRMGWALNRTATFKEDKIYCLLGIFGVFLPLIYGEGEAHAESRLREQIKKQQAGEGTKRLQDLAVSSALPFARNGLFTGRESELQSLEQFLLLDTHRRISLYGLGGCGKSALAIELAYRVVARDAGHLVLWVPAINRESFELAYREIGIRLSVRGITDDNADVKQLVKDALSSDSGYEWLMIVDNADDLNVLMSGSSADAKMTRLIDYLPKSNRGKIVFTTRSRKVAGNLTQNSVLELRDMGKAEARQLLVLRISNKTLLDDEEAVDDLLELLAYLPLAIVQAAAFINNNDVSVSEYISLFQNTGAKTELFGEYFEDPSRYHEMDSTIAKTWHISFDQIRRQDALAAEYLSFMACVDRINIPQSLLPLGGSVVQQTKALGTLKGYAFITERPQASQGPTSEKFYDIHRLVHMALVWWLESHSEQASWTAEAVARLEELVPYGGHKYKEVWMAYLPHATYVAQLAGMLDDTTRAKLLDRVGRCQASLGQYSAAERIHRQALLLWEKSLGREDHKTLTSMNSLGRALEDQGKYAEAKEIYRQTPALSKNVLGWVHPDTLTSMNNLAMVLNRQGEYADAETMSRRTLVMHIKVLGAEHPSTLNSMNNLAGVLYSQGKYTEAETMHRQTLALREKVLGAEHPDTLGSMTNLAAVLDEQGEYAKAETMHRQTLARSELAAEHPSMLRSMSNLAGVLYSQGEYAEAEKMARRALALGEKLLGAEHPDTLRSMNHLAGWLGKQCEYAEAEELYRQALALRDKVLGPDHPDTLTSKYGLAYILAEQHCYDEANTLYQRACTGFQTVLGYDHSYTCACQQSYSEMLIAQEQYQQRASASEVLGTDVSRGIRKNSWLSRALAKMQLGKVGS